MIICFGLFWLCCLGVIRNSMKSMMFSIIIVKSVSCINVVFFICKFGYLFVE